MKFSPYHLAAVSLTLLLAFVPKVHADPIPWGYNWSRSPAEIHADTPGTGKITLSDESQHTAFGDSDIVATNLKTFSTATVANPDIFTAKPYALTLTLTDLVSGTTGSLTFTGLLSGQLTSKSANIGNHYTGLTTQQLILGDTVFTVTIGAYTPPGPPDSSNSGSIGAHTIVKVSHIIPVETLPEPGTLALSLIGLVAIGAGGRWLPGRRRRAIP